jgi:hypothetical protein
LDAFGNTYTTRRKLLVGTGGVPLENFLEYPAEFWVR